MIAERDRRAIRGRGAGFSGATDAARLSYTIYRGHNRRSRETRYVAVRDAGGRATCQNFASDYKVLAFAEAQPLPIGELRGVRPVGWAAEGWAHARHHAQRDRPRGARPAGARRVRDDAAERAPRLGVVGERELTGSRRLTRAQPARPHLRDLQVQKGPRHALARTLNGCLLLSARICACSSRCAPSAPRTRSARRARPSGRSLRASAVGRRICS